jgi:predicted nucleic acid-binding protein
MELKLVLLTAHARRDVALSVLDLTPYEVGNALRLGQAKATRAQVVTVLDALREIADGLRPTAAEQRHAAVLAERYDLTYYDAAYAAVAESRSATLVTLDGALLSTGLGVKPSELVARL